MSEQWFPPTPVKHVAYVKGSSASVKIRLINKRGLPIYGAMTLQGARLAVPGPNSADPGPHYINLTVPTNTFYFYLAPHGGTLERTIAISGLPSHVAVGAFQIKYDMPLTEDPGGEQESTANNGTDGGYENWERICILNSAPIDLQALPWTDFLEYSCRWAYGATSSNDTYVRMTEGMHASRYAHRNWLSYSPLISNFWTPLYDPEEQKPLNLSQFLIDIGDPNFLPQKVVGLDCRGFAGILHLALSSQGLPSSCLIVYPASEGNFTTWPLCPAGADPSLTGPAVPQTPSVSGNYSSYWFSVHMFVYDGTATFDSSSAYLFETFGFSWAKTAYFWNTNSHWQRNSHPYYGLAFRNTTGEPNNVASNSYNFFDVPVGVNSQLIPKIQIVGFRPISIF